MSITRQCFCAGGSIRHRQRCTETQKRRLIVDCCTRFSTKDLQIFWINLEWVRQFPPQDGKHIPVCWFLIGRTLLFQMLALRGCGCPVPEHLPVPPLFHTDPRIHYPLSLLGPLGPAVTFPFLRVQRPSQKWPGLFAQGLDCASIAAKLILSKHR